jgi:hypothetical protein
MSQTTQVHLMPPVQTAMFDPSSRNVMNRYIFVTASLWTAMAVTAQQAMAQTELTYRGLCDASAAVALGVDHFVVADDERNTLQIYNRAQAEPIESVDLSAFLDTKPEKESDLEGAAAIGNRVYWISSHGSNSKGKEQERRYRFFATDVQLAKRPQLFTFGEPYHDLLADLLRSPSLKSYRLDEAAKRPPKTLATPEMPGGLNIEGLASTSDNRMYIGFRNPIARGNALIIPLQNPGKVVLGALAEFGTPIELNLGGRGIRSIEHVGSDYLIIGGPADDGSDFMLYRWSGKAADQPMALPNISFRGMQPEALFAIPQSNKIQILSDDGTLHTGDGPCKDLKDKSRQSFRSIIIKP